MSATENQFGTRPDGRDPDRLFFGTLALAMAAATVVGFAPTYYLRPLGLGHPLSPALTPVIAAHGAVFSVFMLLFVAQTLLVASGRTRLHRRLGLLGLPLLAAMVVLAVLVGVGGVIRESGPKIVPPVAWLAWVLGDVVAFAGLIGAALALCRWPQAHKRLMLLGTAVMMGPALGRALLAAPMPGPLKAIGPPLLVGLALIGWDFASRARLHPATGWGFGFLAATMLLRLPVMFSDWWPPVGAWIVRLLA